MNGGRTCDYGRHVTCHCPPISGKHQANSHTNGPSEFDQYESTRTGRLNMAATQAYGVGPILVTGASGFLGKVVVRELQRQGLRVRSTGRRKSDETLLSYRCVDLVESPMSVLRELVAGVQAVIHVAGLAHQHAPDENHEAQMWTHNTEATERLATAAAEAGVDHFVLISSVSVYGSVHPHLCSEAAPCAPDTSYGRSKLEGEHRLLGISDRTGMNATILRLATLYGEGDPGNVDRLMRAIDAGRFVWVGRGRNIKSLVHRDDAARACFAALQRECPPRARVYNVAGAAYRMANVVGILSRELGRPVPAVRIPSTPVRFAMGMMSFGPWSSRVERLRRTFDKWLRDDAFDGSCFQRECGFEPQVDLAEGLRTQVAAYRAVSGSEVVPSIASGTGDGTAQNRKAA